ncbi:MAG: hypothetical protein U0575_16970 [Phycisphaerales bacterium]
MPSIFSSTLPADLAVIDRFKAEQPACPSDIDLSVGRVGDDAAAACFLVAIDGAP